MSKKVALQNFNDNITSFLRNDATIARNWQLQDRDGILADDTDLASRWANAGTTPFTGAVTIDQTVTPANILKFSTPNLGVTPVEGKGLWIVNPTAAGPGAQQISGAIVQTGNGWATTPAASQTVSFMQDVFPIQGAANPTGAWRLRASVNGGAYSTLLSAFEGKGVIVGNSSVFSGGELLLIRKDQNAGTFFTTVNNTSGTGAYAGLIVSADATLATNLQISVTSPAYSGAAIFPASSTAIVTNLNMVVGTSGAWPLGFWTNQVERARFLSTGELILNRTTTDNSSVFAVWGTGTNPGFITAARAANQLNNGTGFQSVLYNSTNTPVVYTYFNGGIESNTAGAHAGYLAFYIARAANAGAITEAARFLSTGEFLIGYTATTASEVFGVQRNQNAATRGIVVNTTSAAGAFAQLMAATTANLLSGVALNAFSAGWTTAGMAVANTGVAVSTMPNGFNVGTSGPTQLSFWTNGVKVMAIDGAGLTTFLMNKVVFAAPVLAYASANFPHGTTPTTLADGDFWSTTVGAFIRINGVTKTFTLT